MQQELYYEDDIIRTVDLIDNKAYIFKFYPRNKIIRMFDDLGSGENSDDFEAYTDAFDEISYVYDSDEDPAWPITVEFE